MSTATRRRRVNGRLILGVVLVVVSLAGVWFVVVRADATVPVYAARRTIAAGDRVTETDLVAERVALGQADGRYLRSAAAARGLVARRTVAAGELVPVAALEHRADRDRARLVVPVSDAVPATVVAGAAVQLWAVWPRSAGGAETPAVAPQALVDGARVAHVTTDAGIDAREAASVELTLPRDSVASVLQARADGAEFSVVPDGAAAGGAR